MTARMASVMAVSTPFKRTEEHSQKPASLRRSAISRPSAVVTIPDETSRVDSRRSILVATRNTGVSGQCLISSGSQKESTREKDSLESTEKQTKKTSVFE